MSRESTLSKKVITKAMLEWGAWMDRAPLFRKYLQDFRFKLVSAENDLAAVNQKVRDEEAVLKKILEDKKIAWQDLNKGRRALVDRIAETEYKLIELKEENTKLKKIIADKSQELIVMATEKSIKAAPNDTLKRK